MRNWPAVMLVAAALLFPPAAFPADRDFLPKSEKRILLVIAEEMKLTKDETILLLAIRMLEDGRPGRECGVLYKMDGTKLKPYKWRPLSLFENGSLCALAIREKYRKEFGGDLEKFAAWYAPIGAANDPDGLNKSWLPMVRRFMRQMRKAEYVR